MIGQMTSTGARDSVKQIKRVQSTSFVEGTRQYPDTVSVGSIAPGCGSLIDTAEPAAWPRFGRSTAVSGRALRRWQARLWTCPR